MYIVAEYLTYLILLLVLGVALFVTSAIVMVTEEGAKVVAQSTAKLAAEAHQYAARYFKSRPGDTIALDMGKAQQTKSKSSPL